MKHTIMLILYCLTALLITTHSVSAAGVPIVLDDVHIEMWNGDSTYTDGDPTPTQSPPDIKIYSELLIQKGEWEKNGDWVLEQGHHDIDNDDIIDAVTIYRYDTNGNLANKETDHGNDGTMDYLTTYLYNSTGYRELIEFYTRDTLEGSLTLSYNGNGSLKFVEKKTGDGLATLRSSAFTYSWEEDQSLTVTEEDSNFDLPTIYTYNGNRSLISKEQGGYFFSYRYDDSNNLTHEMIEVNNVEISAWTHTYNSNNDLIKIENDSDLDGQIDIIFLLTLDANGNRTKVEAITAEEGTLKNVASDSTTTYVWKKLSDMDTINPITRTPITGSGTGNSENSNDDDSSGCFVESILL